MNILQVVVTGSRTIPTKPYGNERWEYSMTILFQADEMETVIGFEMDKARSIIRQKLDNDEYLAEIHAHTS